ncbi:MAG: DUF3307 domain-containing protein [Pyrinomonadaceae bacterium]
MIVIVKLLLAHLIGDFFLQPESWVKAKENKKLRSWQLYVHAAVHAILSLLVMWDWQFWKWALLIGVIHLIIDAAKITFQTDKTRRAWFVADQLLHLVSLYFVGAWSQGLSQSILPLGSETVIVFFTFALLLTKPTSILVRIIISKWTPHTDDAASLASAGKYIGIIERLLTFLFILSNHWEAVGFLIAAKSIFRFGDLKEAKDRRLTEYVLIGTLLSFGIAIAAGVIALAAALR